MAPPESAPRLLFVPVSAAHGMGEYARSLAIARAAQRRWPDAAIRFLLSRQAAYAADAPFDAILLPSSPTLHTPEVIAAITSFQPQIVIFDNAGRTAQLRAARAAGAAVVYISARARQRRKAGRWSWLRLIDEHWMAYPRFLVAAPSPFTVLKTRLLRRPQPRYLDVMLPAADASRRAALLAGFGLDGAAPIVLVPGGGTAHPGAADAAQRFLAAATAIAASGWPTVYVGPAPEALAPAPRLLRQCVSLPQSDLAELMRAARLVVANGGSTMVQAIACAAPCIAIPIAGDQDERIRRALDAGVVVRSALDPTAIVRAVDGLLDDEPACAALARRAAGLGLADGIAVAIGALGALLDRDRSRAALR